MKNPLRSAEMIAAVTIVALFLCAASKVTPVLGGEGDPAGVEVKIDNFSFGSGTLKVPRGTTVTWINGDDVPHTVVSTKKYFASAVLDTGDKFSYTFRNPGTYPYYCSVHPKMTAKVVVK